MPKAAAHFHNGRILWEDQIWSTGQLANVKPVPKPFLMKYLTDRQLWLGILWLDRAHNPRPFLRQHALDHCGLLLLSRYYLIERCAQDDFTADLRRLIQTLMVRQVLHSGSKFRRI